MEPRRSSFGTLAERSGRAFLEKAHSSLFQEIGHGHTIDELLPLLDGLPFREEVPGGRDLGGCRGPSGVR